MSQQKRRGGTITSGRDNLSGGTGELSYFYNATAMHAYFLKRSINSNLLIVSLTMPTNFLFNKSLSVTLEQVLGTALWLKINK